MQRIMQSLESSDAMAPAVLEQVTMRRVTRRLIPFLFLLYIVSFVDRTNVSFAALQMNRDLGFSAAVYGLGAGIFFLGYALFEVPSNLILARVGARRWIARIAITWGLLASAMMFVRSAESFYALRFLLGVAEAGYFPGVVYYLSQWFPERQRARAMSRFMIGIPISGAVGGVLGGALLALDGRMGLAGWQWLFLLEGIPAVILGVVTLRWLTDRPEDAHWLPEAERLWLRRRLDEEVRSRHRGGEPSLRRALASPVVWWLSAPYFIVGVTGYALLLWLPTLVKELAHAGDQGVALVMTLTGVGGAVAMLANGARSDRRGERLAHSAVPLVVAAVACVAGAVTEHPALAVTAVAVAACVLPAFIPIYWCLPTTVLHGAAAAGGVALINSIGNVGGFVGPAALGVVREATGSFASGLLALAALALGAALLTLSLRRAFVSRGARADTPSVLTA